MVRIAVIAVILLATGSAWSAEQESTDAKPSPTERWKSEHPDIAPMPDLTLPTDEVSELPEVLAGTWWNKAGPALVVTKKSIQIFDENGPNNPPDTYPKAFKTILKYRTTDGSIVVRVSFEKKNAADEVFRFIPKHGVVINSFKPSTTELAGPRYLTIQ